MNKTNDMSIEKLCYGMGGLTMTISMAVLIAASSESLKDTKEFQKMFAQFNSFNELVKKNFGSSKELSRNTVISEGRKFINELNAVRKLPEADSKDIQEVITDTKEVVISIIEQKQKLE